MNIVLWIIQVLLALAFLMAGTLKATQPLDKLAGRMGWIRTMPPSAVRAIGAVEILGAIGLIVPALLGILPWLTPLAGVGLALTMVGALALHLSRREYHQLAPSGVLLILAAIVAVGRGVLVPF